jgi:hypothetical protein
MNLLQEAYTIFVKTFVQKKLLEQKDLRTSYCSYLATCCCLLYLKRILFCEYFDA